MYAMACHMYSVAEADKVDFERLDIEFGDAVRAGINAEDKSITTLQAFAVMFLVDCARANSLRASLYLTVVTNNLASVAFLEGGGFPEVWKNTVRGARNLNVLVNCDSHFPVPANRLNKWAQITFQTPPMVHPTQPGLIEEDGEEVDDLDWHFYRYVNDQCLAFPGLLATTNREKSKLVEIINDIAIIMYT